MFKQYQAILCLLLAGYITCVTALDFTGANWIWTSGRRPDGYYPPGNVAFRRAFFSPNGKTPVSAEILITADNAYTLYVNGLRLGSGSSFLTAQRYCVPLVKECNVFAVSAENAPVAPPDPFNPAGLLAAIEIRYSDGSTETIVTDGQWRVINGVPAGFEQVAFDDSQWPAAFNEGPYPNTPPWNNPATSVVVPPDNQITPRPLTLDSAFWVWTNEVTGPTSNAPIGPRAFRKTVVVPNGQIAAQARFLITSDNEYTLYVNGQVVGSGNNFFNAQRYIVNFPPTDRIVIAVFARNVSPGGPASLIVATEIVTCDCAENINVVSNSSWKYSINIPVDFTEPDYDDSAWPTVFVEGRQGVQPWGNTNIPAGNSPQSPPLDGAPSAPPASVVT